MSITIQKENASIIR